MHNRTPRYVWIAITAAIVVFLGVVITATRMSSPSPLRLPASWPLFWDLLPWLLTIACGVGLRIAYMRARDMGRAKIIKAGNARVPERLTYSPHVTMPAGASSIPPALEDVTPAQPLALPGVTDMQEVLRSFTPSPDRILLALAEGGTPLTVSIKQLCHIAEAGPTDGGKSNIKRLCLSQILACGMDVVLADPKYTPLDPQTGEDWRPIASRLRFPPAVTPQDITELLRWANSELDRRLALRARGEDWGSFLFLSIDELPEVVAQVGEAPAIMGRLARLGRALGMFLETAAQDWLVKSTGGDGAMRSNFLTTYYLGGDLRTGSVLLGLPQKTLSGLHLPLGVAMLRSKATPEPARVRVPLMSNEALYRLLPEVQQASGGAAVDLQPAPVDITRTSELHVVSTAFQSSKPATPHEQRILDLFYRAEEPLDIAPIVRELWPDTKPGRTMQERSAEVQAVLRKQRRAA